MSPDTGCIESVVDAIYAAALQPEYWQAETLPKLGAWIGGADICHILGWNDQTSEIRFHFDSSDIFTAQELYEHDVQYFSRYRSIDPRPPVIDKHLTQRMGADSEFLDARTISGSEFYQDYLNGLKHIRSSAGGRLIQSEGLRIDVAFERTKDRGPFNDHQMQRLNQIAPHLRRALLIHQKATQLDMLPNFAKGLNALDHGVVLLNKAGTVLHANLRAEAILRERSTLRLANARLTSSIESAQRTLSEAIERVHRTGAPTCLMVRAKAGSALPHWCAIMLTRAFNQRVGMKNGDWFAKEHHVIGLLHQPTTERAPSGAQLMQLFALTPGEARVVRALLSGMDVEAAAHSLGLKECTVRSHIRAALNKTNTSGITDLCRTLIRLPSLRC